MNPLAKAKVSDVVRHSSDIVERDVLVTHLTAVRPMVSEIPSPSRRVTVQAGAVNLKLFVSQFDQAKGRNSDSEVA